MKNTLTINRLCLIAFLVSLSTNLPRLVLLLNRGEGQWALSWSDWGLQIVYGFLLAALMLYLQFFTPFSTGVLSDSIGRRIGLYVLIYVVCTVVFVQTHWRLLASDEPLRSFRMGYFFRDLFIMGVSILIANFMKAQNQKQTLQIRNQHLENEKLKAELNALRQQLNPHFLFNSLNTLGSLMREDVEKSQFYLENLAIVLRFSLDVQQKELIPLSEELRLLRAYAHLLTIRFGEKLTIDFKNLENTEGVQTGFLPPLALQLLVENAVKHNEISSKKPLRIEIKQSDDGAFLEVHNNLNPKPQHTEGGLGLHNLNARYELLSQKSIEIQKDAHFFKVILPILKHENPHHRR
jgi:two-component system, LytTR family, sensor kinase